MDGNFTNKYRHNIFGYLFFDIIFAADDGGRAKCQELSDNALYGEKQQRDRKACKSADSNEINLPDDNGCIASFILYAVAEWKNELHIAQFPESYFAPVKRRILGMHYLFLYLLFWNCRRYGQTVSDADVVSCGE